MKLLRSSLKNADFSIGKLIFFRRRNFKYKDAQRSFIFHKATGQFISYQLNQEGKLKEILCTHIKNFP